MYHLLFFFWEIIAFVFFFYSVPKTDFRGTFIFISMLLFFALAFSSIVIEIPYVFYDETTSSVIEHTYYIYSEGNARLSAGMGILSMVLGFVKIFYLKDLEADE